MLLFLSCSCSSRFHSAASPESEAALGSSTRLVFHRPLERRQLLVPPGGDLVEAAPRESQARRLELPEVLASPAGPANEPSVGEDLEGTRDGLPRDQGVLRQLRDRQRISSGEAGGPAQTGLVAPGPRRGGWFFPRPVSAALPAAPPPPPQSFAT